MKTLLNYPGAKWGMAEQIISLMPRHRSYLEPFFGSGAVLFNKPPSAIETVNDIDGDVVNFFKVLRERPEELAEAISLTPYARDVFDDAHENSDGVPVICPYLLGYADEECVDGEDGKGDCKACWNRPLEE